MGGGASKHPKPGLSLELVAPLHSIAPERDSIWWVHDEEAYSEVPSRAHKWYRGYVAEVRKTSFDVTLEEPWSIPQDSKMKETTTIETGPILNMRQQIKRATCAFHGMPWDKLTEEMFSDPNPNSTDESFRLSKPMKPGKIDWFVSHAWNDDPKEKWKALASAGAVFHKERGRWPTLWMSKFCVAPEHFRWLIDGLHVYILGCRGVLVLAGPHYARMFRTVWELHTLFAVSTRKPSLTFRTFTSGTGQHPIQEMAEKDGSLDESEAAAAILEQWLNNFDMEHCEKCYNPNNQRLLINLIEASPGGLARYIKAVKSMGKELVMAAVLTVVRRKEKLDAELELRRYLNDANNGAPNPDRTGSVAAVIRLKPEQPARQESTAQGGVKTWLKLRGGSKVPAHKKVARRAQDPSSAPDLEKLAAAETCCDFPSPPLGNPDDPSDSITSGGMGPKVSGGAACFGMARYHDSDLANADLTDPVQRQCTQLGYECEACGLLNPFDAAVKLDELDDKFRGFCGRKCNQISTFRPTVGPCDVLGLCFGLGGGSEGGSVKTWGSIYGYSSKYIAVHHGGSNLAPAHFMIVPTTVAIPDFLAMCVQPAGGDAAGLDGVQILAEMKEFAMNVYLHLCGEGSQSSVADNPDFRFAPNLKVLGQIYGLTGEDLADHNFMADGLPKKLLAWFETPAAQSQLHLNVAVLPLYESALEEVRATTSGGTSRPRSSLGWPRALPLRLAERVVPGVRGGKKSGSKSGSKVGMDKARKLVGGGVVVAGTGGGPGVPGSDWHEFLWSRIEGCEEMKRLDPFIVEGERARNDLIVLPQCFYHGVGGEGYSGGSEDTMEEWLGDRYRSELDVYCKSLLTGGATKPAPVGANGASDFEALITKHTDRKTALVKSASSYFKLVAEALCDETKPNVVTEYLSRRLSVMPNSVLSSL